MSAFKIVHPPGWQEIYQKIKSHGGLGLVLGAIDVGKSTFIRWLANQFLKDKLKIALIDADIGQSDIGPPGTIGLSFPQKTFSNYSKLSVDRLYFVGSVSPQGHFLQCLVGLKLLLESAQKSSPDLIIVDSTGWIDHPAAWAFKSAKIDLLKPDFIIAFQKERELYPLLKLYKNSVIKIYYPEIVPEVKTRTPEERALNREKKFKEYFKEAELIILDIKKIIISGNSGKPTKGLSAVLIDKNNTHLALGLIVKIDESRKSLEILTPFDQVKRIKRIQLAKLKPDIRLYSSLVVRCSRDTSN